MPKALAALAQYQPEILLATINFQDVPASAFSHVVAGGELEHRRLPDGGSCMNLLQCRLPSTVICQGLYEPAVLINGTFARNAVTLGTMLFQGKSTIINGSKVRTGTVQFCSERSEICYRAWPGASWFAVVIPREKLLRFSAEYLENVPEFPSKGIVTIAPETAEAGVRFAESLRSICYSLRSLDRKKGARLGELENDILAKMVQFISGKPLVTQENDHRRFRMRWDVFRDTTRLVKSDPNEVLNLHVMSTATGLSIRTIQRVLQAELGLSSLEWMRVERLHRVREDLLDERQSTSVMKAATRWGFVHLGRFSKYYRDLFGESPSMTISRRTIIQNNMQHMNFRTQIPKY